MIGAGSNGDFHHSLTTSASRQAVWTLWTDPGRWGDWDQGLISAEADGPLGPGVRGRLVPRSGPTSLFEITQWRPLESYEFTTRLPFARLVVKRFFSGDQPTRITHHVRFQGPLRGLWASQFGPGFRRALPPTLEALAALAAAEGP